MVRWLAFVLVVVACTAVHCNSGSKNDGGEDGGVGECSTSTDASFTCDTSAVNAALLGCGNWTGPATLSDGGYSCPTAVDWFVSLTGTGTVMSTCDYSWQNTTPPNLCDLPQSSSGVAPFVWLTPACCE